MRKDKIIEQRNIKENTLRDHGSSENIRRIPSKSASACKKLAGTESFDYDI